MSTLNSLGSSAGTAAAVQPKRNQLQELGSDQFIALMVAQMKNQDPMKPTDPSEFLGQLAQFSTVSGVRAMQDSMGDMVTAMRSSQMLSGTQMVGRDVLASGSQLNYDGVGTVQGAADMPRFIQSASVMIKDSAGAVVRQLPISSAAGLNGFTWDGKSDTGAAVPSGRYSIEIVARSASRTEPVAPLLQSKVNSITLDSAGGGLILNTSNGELPLNAVRRVL